MQQQGVVGFELLSSPAFCFQMNIFSEFTPAFQEVLIMKSSQVKIQPSVQAYQSTPNISIGTNLTLHQSTTKSSSLKPSIDLSSTRTQQAASKTLAVNSTASDLASQHLSVNLTNKLAPFISGEQLKLALTVTLNASNLDKTQSSLLKKLIESSHNIPNWPQTNMGIMPGLMKRLPSYQSTITLLFDPSDKTKLQNIHCFHDSGQSFQIVAQPTYGMQAPALQSVAVPLGLAESMTSTGLNSPAQQDSSSPIQQPSTHQHSPLASAVQTDTQTTTPTSVSLSVNTDTQENNHFSNQANNATIAHLHLMPHNLSMHGAFPVESQPLPIQHHTNLPVEHHFAPPQHSVGAPPPFNQAFALTAGYQGFLPASMPTYNPLLTLHPSPSTFNLDPMVTPSAPHMGKIAQNMEQQAPQTVTQIYQSQAATAPSYVPIQSCPASWTKEQLTHIPQSNAQTPPVRNKKRRRVVTPEELQIINQMNKNKTKHSDIAEFIGFDRSTITKHLNAIPGDQKPATYKFVPTNYGNRKPSAKRFKKNDGMAAVSLPNGVTIAVLTDDREKSS